MGLPGDLWTEKSWFAVELWRDPLIASAKREDQNGKLVRKGPNAKMVMYTICQNIVTCTWGSTNRCTGPKSKACFIYNPLLDSWSEASFGLTIPRAFASYNVLDNGKTFLLTGKVVDRQILCSSLETLIDGLRGSRNVSCSEERAILRTQPALSQF